MNESHTVRGDLASHPSSIPTKYVSPTGKKSLGEDGYDEGKLIPDIAVEDVDEAEDEDEEEEDGTPLLEGDPEIPVEGKEGKPVNLIDLNMLWEHGQMHDSAWDEEEEKEEEAEEAGEHDAWTWPPEPQHDSYYRTEKQGLRLQAAAELRLKKAAPPGTDEL